MLPRTAALLEDIAQACAAIQRFVDKRDLTGARR